MQVGERTVVTRGDFPAGTGIYHVTHDKTHIDGPESCA